MAPRGLCCKDLVDLLFGRFLSFGYGGLSSSPFFLLFNIKSFEGIKQEIFLNIIQILSFDYRKIKIVISFFFLFFYNFVQDIFLPLPLFRLPVSFLVSSHFMITACRRSFHDIFMISLLFQQDLSFLDRRVSFFEVTL